MELIVILALLGWGGYKFFKFNTASGAEVLRAYLYLEVLLKGGTREVATRIAARDMIDVDTDVMRRILDEVQAIHNGKSLQVVAEAYRQGMTSSMPGWYQASAKMRRPADTIFFVYTARIAMKERELAEQQKAKPAWVRRFTIYFVVDRLAMAPRGMIPGSVLIPEELITLIDHDEPSELQIALPASLRLYMEFLHPDVGRYDLGPVFTDVQEYMLQAMRRIGDLAVIRSVIQKRNLEFTGTEMDAQELDEFMGQFRTSTAAEVTYQIYGMCLLSLSEDDFQTSHGKTYELFSREMAEFCAARPPYLHDNSR